MFKGLGQFGDMAKIMKQAQEMQGKMASMQERLDTIEVFGEAGAGLVKATSTAKGRITALVIDEKILQPSEPEVLIEGRNAPLALKSPISAWSLPKSLCLI